MDKVGIWFDSNCFWHYPFSFYHHWPSKNVLGSLQNFIWIWCAYFLCFTCTYFCAHSQESNLAGGGEGPFWLSWQAAWLLLFVCVCLFFVLTELYWIYDLLWPYRTQTNFHHWASFLASCRLASVIRQAYGLCWFTQLSKDWVTRLELMELMQKKAFGGSKKAETLLLTDTP